jgi:hypothetical protein
MSERRHRPSSEHSIQRAGHVPALAPLRSRKAGPRQVHGRDWACSLRDIFANPFRSVTVATCWLTPQPVVLAQAIYDDRAFDGLPILADALEELARPSPC